jgi:parallel beta-helix repeat protein
MMPEKRYWILIIVCIFILHLSVHPNLIQSNINQGNISESQPQNINNKENPKNSGFWTPAPFIIDDSGGGDYNWSEAAGELWCSGSGNWTHPYIIENITINAGNSGNCLEIKNSNVYFIIRNSTFYNSGNFDYGIYLSNVDNGLLTKNNISDNGFGIFVSSSNNNTILGNNISDNSLHGLYLLSGNSFNNLVGNNISSNTADGINVDTNNNYNNIIGNNINDHLGGYGLFLTSGNANISSNNVLRNDYGIYVSSCNNNTILENNASYNTEDGIYLFSSDLNTIMGNNVSYNNFGIYVRSGSEENNISSNIAHDNFIGINLASGNNNISNNELFDNGRGMNIGGSSNSIIRNQIFNNTNYGVFMGGSNNIFYNNSFINNNINARDDGLNNDWNNTDIGNYWDDYTGYDDDLNDIGDTPYNIPDGSAGSKDYLPIWNLQSDHLFIDSPINNTIWASAPLITARTMAENLSHIWYNVSGNPTKEFLTNNTPESLNDTLWGGLPEGIFKISFYSNDTLGSNIDNSTYTFYKNSLAPTIKINLPTGGTVYNATTPSFNVEIFDINLDKMWYSLNNLYNFTFISNNTFDAGNWTALTDGTINVTFYANDTYGLINLTQVLITKDSEKPSITVISPIEGEAFTITPPNIQIQVTDVHLESIWYSINGGENMTYIGNGQLSKDLWDDLPVGTITIIFYANDSVGNQESMMIRIKKEDPQPEGIDFITYIVMLSVIIGLSVIILVIIFLKYYYH